MTKKKFIKPLQYWRLFSLGSLEMDGAFNMVVRCKKGEQKKERKKWFELVHQGKSSTEWLCQRI